jgi:predicted extracellular nuclease
MYKNNILSLLFALTLAFAAQAQKQLIVAFYNQESLFDTINDPDKNDEEFLPMEHRKYTNKINNMAKVIASMNEGNGPDILGMCEVENDNVLNDLTKNKQLAKLKYGFVRFDSPDERSIDNALLYQSKKFTLVASKAYPVIFSDNPKWKTRDILMVKLMVKQTKTPLIVLVNHFPSRIGGEAESAPKRKQAATVLRNVYDSIVKADPSTPVIMMGDFNDEPTDESMKQVLNAKGHTSELANTDLFNAMYELKEQKKGSHYYKNEWSALDQIIMSNNLVSCTGKVCYKTQSVSIYQQDWMIEQEGKYKGSPLRTFGGQKYLNGYSDHLPVYVILELKK